MTRVELHVNGSLIVQLKSEGNIERTFFDEMAAASELGKKVRFVKAEDGSYSISTERAEKTA